METFPEAARGTTRDIVAAAVGINSGRNYDRAKYVVDKAPAEIVAKMDENEKLKETIFTSGQKPRIKLYVYRWAGNDSNIVS